MHNECVTRFKFNSNATYTRKYRKKLVFWGGGYFVCVCVCVGEGEGTAYSLHFSVSRSLDSCLRAFSVSPTTASTPFSCVCVCMCRGGEVVCE
jgi:hypothetical protein